MSFAARLYRLARAHLADLKFRKGRERTVDADSSEHAFEDSFEDGFEAADEDLPGGPAHDPTLAGYYANLELPYGADLAAVEAAWKRLMRQYHPDLHGADPRRQQVATEIVQGLNMAYRGLREHLRGA